MPFLPDESHAFPIDSSWIFLMKKANSRSFVNVSNQAEPAGATLLPWSKPDHNNPTPLYYQIYQLYKQRILSGNLKLGDKLPSESVQESAYGVSRITARRAMDELARDGLVTRERGRGTTVSYVLPSSTVAADFSGLIENLVAISATTDVEVLSFEYCAAPAHVADALEIEAGAMVQKAERKRSKDGKPLSYILTFLPENIGRSFARSDLCDQPILSLIEQAGHIIAEAEQSVTALIADSLTAQILQVEVGAALLKVNRIVRDHTGVPVQYIEVFYRPDAYQLNMRLVRVNIDSETRLLDRAECGSD